jgi:hypothetical protein
LLIPALDVGAALPLLLLVLLFHFSSSKLERNCSGRSEYPFVVDGQWIEDPQAKQRAANPHGGFHSVLDVSLPVRPSILQTWKSSSQPRLWSSQVNTPYQWQRTPDIF